MAILNFSKRTKREDEIHPIAQEKITIFDKYVGGSGCEIGALSCLMSPGEALYAKHLGSPQLTNPETYMVDMDAEARGLEKMALIEGRLNVIAANDVDGTAFGYNRIVNASISPKMEGTRGERTSINDMIHYDDKDGRRMKNAVLTEEEANLPREVGGQGKPKLVSMWQHSAMKIETMQTMVSNIRKTLNDGRKVLVRITGSATGATGATFLNTLSKYIYQKCMEDNPGLINNLRIHSIVILGYAVHPGADESSAFELDSTEDDAKVLNWFKNRVECGVDSIVNRTYFVHAKPAVCYEFFARGGNQGRHYCLGDLLALAAINDSTKTAFDAERDGYHVFVPSIDNDPRFGWGNINDTAFKQECINYLRFCAAVWLKLRPMTNVSHEEVRVAPHVVKMLGKNAPADQLEQKVIRPIQAMVGIAGEVLTAFMEIGASGSDFSRDVVTLTADDTTVFNPFVIKKIINGDIDERDVNSFDPDLLTEFAKGSGTANVTQTNETIGSAYNGAVQSISKGASAAEFMLALYRRLAI